MGRQAQRAQPMNLADRGWAAQTAPRSDEFTTPRFSAARPSSLARPRPKKCHIVQPFSRSNSLKTKKTCAKEVSQHFEAYALLSPGANFPRNSPQITWDTVPLNFTRNSLKTKHGDTHQVGHFFDLRLLQSWLPCSLASLLPDPLALQTIREASTISCLMKSVLYKGNFSSPARLAGLSCLWGAVS
jgi:hypothetical protein